MCDYKKGINIYRYDAVAAMRAMEEFTRECGGYPFLYADIFMTRDEFEKMFDLTGGRYATLRKYFSYLSTYITRACVKYLLHTIARFELYV